MVAAAGSDSHPFTVSLGSNGKHMMLFTDGCGSGQRFEPFKSETSVRADAESHSLLKYEEKQTVND